MSRSRKGLFALATALVLGAAPATPSYYEVERLLTSIQESWKSIPPEQNPHRESWVGFFNSIQTELNHYKAGTDPEQRLAALKALGRKADALQSVPWVKAAQIRQALLSWIRPRAALVWAEYRVLEAVAALPANQSAKRQEWNNFVQQGLRPTVADFEGAANVVQRREALEKLDAAIKALRRNNATAPWSRSLALESALAGLYEFPNLNVWIDSGLLSSTIGRQGIVEPGWIYFRDQWSYVTPGPIVGLGFVPTADGIGLAISQAVSNVTPIQGFQQQVAQDDKGKRAAKLYQFDATSRNHAVLTIHALFRLATGLQLAPGYQHNISATITSAPKAGKGLARGIASLIGYNQDRITDEVYEGAIGQIRSQVVDGASDLAGIKASQKANDLNARIRPFIIDAQTAGTGRVAVGGIRLQSTSNLAMVTGTVYDPSTAEVTGASFPVPGFGPLGYGANVAIHIPSVVSNVSGLLQDSPQTAGIENIMVVIPPQGPNGEPPDVRVEQNVDFATYLAEVEKGRASKTQVIRVLKPKRRIKAEVDAQGRLAMLVPDFQIDVPAPAAAARGGGLTGPPAKVYRIQSDLAEFVLSMVIDANSGYVPRVSGKLEGFDPGANVRVIAINEDEASGQALNAFTARVVANTFGAQLAGRPLDFPLTPLANAPVAITAATPIDPSGWMRVTVVPR